MSIPIPEENYKEKIQSQDGNGQKIFLTKKKQGSEDKKKSKGRKKKGVSDC